MGVLLFPLSNLPRSLSKSDIVLYHGLTRAPKSKLKKRKSVSRCIEWHKRYKARIELNASHPWSKSYPSGEEEPVLLACFPSQQSKVCCMKTANAA